jgi:hypothetical protein
MGCLMSRHIKLIKIFSIIISMMLYALFFLFIDFSNLEDGYHITILLPFIFLCCFFMFLWDPVFNKRTPFIVLFTCVAFIRYVVLSFITVNNGSYMGISGVHPSPESLTFAGLLMCWELIVSSMFLYYWSKKKLSYNLPKVADLTSNANVAIYIAVIIFSVALLILIPQARQGLSFFGDVTYTSEVESVFILGLRELFVNAKYFLIFTLIIILKRRNKVGQIKNRLSSYLTVLITSILIIGIRVGTNRKQLLSDSLAVLLTLWRAYPKFKKTTTISITSIAILLVAITTLFRGMTDSLNSFFLDYFDMEFLQPYFLGQYNVAIAIEASSLFSYMIDIKTYILGFIRPLFGIGSFIGNIDFTMVATLFDARMSMGLLGTRGDQILPMVGEGYILFGFILSPLFLIITVRLGIFFDSLYTKSKNLEIVFISSIISFYLAQGMILNSTIILNMLSFRLAIFIPIVWLAYLFTKQNKVK